MVTAWKGKGSWHLTIACGAIALTVVAAGCGDDNGSSAPAPTATKSATAQPTTAPTPAGAKAGAGLSSTITNALVATQPAGQVIVTFTLTDAAGIPLTPVLSSAQNDQQGRVRFTIAHVESYMGGGDLATTFTRYVNDINVTHPAYDSKGKLETVDAATGVYHYTFAAVLPAAGYDPTRTYSVGLQVDRTYQGTQLSANPVFDFVPVGGTPAIREGVTTAQCNSCHNPLIAHGNRREVRLCTLCHAEAAVDPKDTTIDFRNMIHKIHRGKDLPSIVNGQPGAQYAIFSSFSNSATVFAEKNADGTVTGVGFPRAIEACVVCHADGATASYHLEKPSTAACASCHDDVNPSKQTTAAGGPGTNHFQGLGYEEGECRGCHKVANDPAREFDITVTGAHVVPERSTQLKGINVDIVGITNHAAGQIPTISFKISEGHPPDTTPLTSLTGFDRLGFTITGPTTDYTVMLALTAAGGGATGTITPPGDDGVFQYTPKTGIPANATGTWVVGAELRRAVQLTVPPDTPAKSVEEAAVNPVVTFTVDDSTAVVRRVVVEDQRCAACHGEFSKDFSIHGNLRNQTEYCVLCHNPNQSDQARRKLDSAAVARGDSTTSIDFKVMIHKIHRGENLETQPYLIYGFGVAPPAGTGYSINNFGEVRFPGDLRDCQTCHAPDTYLLPPFPGTALGTRTAHLDPATGNEVQDGRLGPITSVCTACHDGEDAKAHAATQTAPDGAEACAVCHEEGRAFAVSELHAGRN